VKQEDVELTSWSAVPVFMYKNTQA